VAALLSACGGSSAEEPTERGGTYEVKVTEVEFPASQSVGETALLRLGVRNLSRRPTPALTVTFSIAGEDGQQSSLPFAVHDRGAGIAQADRPVWVLAEKYPRLVGSSSPAGATTSNRKTFNFGTLGPGETTTGIWKLSAVRPGSYTLLYRVGAGLGGAAKAETKGGGVPGGAIRAEISTDLPETEVTDSGEVVEIEKGK
jgi:hypothetical protein